MTPSEAAGLVGQLVKLEPRRGHNGYVVARLHAISGDQALVTPKAHKHTEWVDVARIRRWLKGSALANQRR